MARDQVKQSAEDFRRRVEHFAEAITRQVKAAQDLQAESFIDAIGDIFEDIGQGIIDATEAVVEGGENFAQIIAEVAQQAEVEAMVEAMISAAAEATEITADVAVATVAVLAVSPEQVAGAEARLTGAQARAGASAAQLIELRRQILSQHTATLKSRIEEVRRRFQTELKKIKK